MKNIIVAMILTIVTIGSAQADSIKVFNSNGSSKYIDIESLDGCVVFFDSNNGPLEICRLEETNDVNNTTIIINEDDDTYVGNDRAQDRRTARRTYRRMDRRDERRD